VTTTTYPATLLCDFYKISHRAAYPEGTETVYSTWIPRESRMPGVDHVVAFGVQGFVRAFLVEYFNEHFFSRPLDDVLAEYDRIVTNTLGVEPDHDHIRELHELGYLPLEIKALPEGTLVPLRVPIATVENTDPRFFWLTNYIETLWSAEVWHSATSASLAHAYRLLLDEWAIKTTGSTAGVEFQSHDFSIRGMTSLDSAAKSGSGHLLSFVGTDNIPAICYLEKYYGADVEKELVGTSIPATEHSVMCAYGQDEATSYRRIITEVYPSGLVSIVSDTWDLWNVLTRVIPGLKDEILARDGKVVIRPDSGDPVNIICGYDGPDHDYRNAEEKGVIELLWQTFGGTVNAQGYKVLDPHVGAIYGDSITPERAARICERLARKGFASTNVVFGVGSFTYQYVTRDTFGFAMKSTWCKINGEGRAIFKDPVTDKSHVKRSLTGRVAVVREDSFAGALVAVDGLDEDSERTYAADNELFTIFRDGLPRNMQTLANIRKILADQTR
jgi:nicotinamide phosphoribosyltransferase